MVQAITFEDEEVPEDKSIDEVFEDEVVETNDGEEDTEVEIINAFKVFDTIKWINI